MNLKEESKKKKYLVNIGEQNCEYLTFFWEKIYIGTQIENLRMHTFNTNLTVQAVYHFLFLLNVKQNYFHM